MERLKTGNNGRCRTHQKKRLVNSSPVSATTLCDQKRYRTGKPRSRNGFGVFSRPFWLYEKKISSHLFPVRWGLELKLRAFAPNFEWATRKNFSFFEKYFVKFLWTKWFVQKCSTNHFSIPHILAVTFLRWRPFLFSDKIKTRAQKASRTGENQLGSKTVFWRTTYCTHTGGVYLPA